MLRHAHPERARLLLVTTPDPLQARAVIDRARQANPAIRTVVRTHSGEERAYLEEHGAGLAVMGARELALTMARHALVICGAGQDATAAHAEDPLAARTPSAARKPSA